MYSTMLIFMMMKSVLKHLNNSKRRFNWKNLKGKKSFIFGIVIGIAILLSFLIYYISSVKPNSDIFLQSTNSHTIYGNKNPKFSVDFGKRDQPDVQWVRFESDISKRNPFEENTRGFWDKVKNFFRPIKSYGIEMSIKGVKVSDLEKLNDKDEEKLKEVSEIMGNRDIKSNTELVDLGRVFGEEEKDSITKKTVVNKEISKGIDLEYQIIEGIGLKEEIIIRNLDSYIKDCEDVQDCSLPANEYVFDLSVEEGLMLKKGWFNVGEGSREVYYFEDRYGNYVSHFLPSFAVDGVNSKTYDVEFNISHIDGGRYEIRLVLDSDWLYSNDRVFPIRIDPSIVHNSKVDFDSGTYISSDYVSSVSGVELLGVEKPVVDSNTVGHWSFGDLPYFSASGGTVTRVGDYVIHTFTSSGTFTAHTDGKVDVLVIGGGGGGANTGSGGGAGGFVEQSSFTVSKGNIAVTVGNGGNGGADGGAYNGNKGQDSAFSSLIAEGGGAGITHGQLAGGSGGSGGGGAVVVSAPLSTGGIGSQGYNGGAGYIVSGWVGTNGGGGGAGGVGADGGNSSGSGNGGAGRVSDITGTAVVYAGGGGGGEVNGSYVGTGGNGGGGSGVLNGAGTNGIANTGGGGGGGSFTGAYLAGGNGGSGIVIVRYRIPALTPAADSSTNNNHIATSLNGMSYGIQSSNLTFKLNRYGGVDNAGEIDIECTYGDANCYFIDRNGIRIITPTINSGIAVTDAEAGSGYIMYSPSLSAQGITGLEANNSNHFVAVKYSGSSWQYNNNATWVNFTPTTNNIIVAEVTFFTSIKLLDISPIGVDGKIGKGYEFDGENDYITVPNSGLGTGDKTHTIDLWIKPYTLPTIRQWLLVMGGYDQGNIHLIYGTDGNIYAGIWSGSQCPIRLDISQWNHIAFTYNGTNMYCYKNGVQVSSNAPTVGVPVNLANTELNIGKGPGSEVGFNGLVDEVRLSNIARSADEIYKTYLYGKERYSGEYESTVFDSGSSVSKVNVSSTVSGINTGDGEVPYSTTGLVAQWNFNESSGTVASSGGSCGSGCNGTLTNFSDTTGQDKVIGSGWTYNNRRWGGGGLMFDGVDDYVTASNSTVGDFSTGDFSLEVWFKADYAIAESFPTLISKQVFSPTRIGYNLSVISINGEPKGKILFEVHDSGGTKNIGSSNFIVVDDQWHHVVATKSSTILSLYLDGRLADVINAGPINSVSNSTNLEMGRLTNAGGNNYKGLMDSVRIYSRSLTSSEVLSNYNSGNTRFHIRGGNSNNPNDGTWSEWKENTAKSTLRSFDNSSLYNNKEDGLVGYWSMNEESGTTVSDISGTGNNGTATGTGIVDGKYAKARSFNGNTGVVRIPNSSSLDINGAGSKITVSFWMNISDMSQRNWHTLLYKADTNPDSGVNRQYAMFLNQSGTLVFSSTAVDNIGVGQTDVGWGYINPNTWYHIVGTIDSTNGYMRIYLNGALMASTAYSSSGIRQGSGDLFIAGDNTYPNGTLSGIIDEVKLYNKALAADRIQSDYLEGIEKRSTLTQSSSNMTADNTSTLDDSLVSHWKMDELSGSEVKDSVGSSNGSATGTTIVDGKYDKARSFNGSTDYITLPNTPDLDINGSGSQLSVATWFKTSTLSGTWMDLINKNTGAADCSETNCSDRQYMLVINTVGKYISFISTSVDNIGVASTVLNSPVGIIAEDSWYHVVGVIDSPNSVIRLYVNGKEVSSIPYSNMGIRQASGDIIINRWKGFNGIVDDVRIYNAAKTSDEIERLYNQELPYKSNRIGTTVNDGLVSYWKMDENSGSVVKDSVGTYNGTATGTTIAQGKANNSRSFNGTSDYVQVPLIDFSSFTSMSASIWVKTTTTSNSMLFQSRGLFLYINAFSSTGKVLIDFDNTSGNNSATHESKSSINDGNWHLITGTNDGTKTRLYIDGVLENEFASTFTLGPDKDTYLGSNIASAGFFNGQLDEPKIYNRTLSTQEIFEEYSSLKTIFEKKNTGLISYWDMDELSGTTVADKVGDRVGTATGTTIVDGRVGKSRSFNGTNDYITVPNSGLGTGDKVHTVDLWLKPYASPTMRQWILGLGGYEPSNIHLVYNVDGNISAGIWNGAQCFIYLDISQWNHVTFSYDGTNIYCYKNGAQVSTSAVSTYAVTVNLTNTELNISKQIPGEAGFNGLIDEVKIYNRALSASEILAEYTQGVDRNSSPKSIYSNYLLPTQNLSSKISLPVYIASDKVGENISTTVGESAYANYQPDANTVGLWHLDEIDGNGAYIKDSSGYNNNGMSIGTTYTNNGRIGGARNFNGTSDYIVIPDSTSLNPSAITLEAWIKPKEFNDVANFINKGDNSGYRIRLNTTGALEFLDRGGTNVLLTPINLVELNKWYHVVATGDSSGLKIYLNGELKASNSTAYGSPVTTYNLRLSGYSNLPYIGFTNYVEMFNGEIDEVRISNIARSADEIRQAYEVGLRTHNIEIEFGAGLDSSNLITSSSDTSFTIDGTVKGMKSKGSNIYTGEKIIVREQNSSGEYIAQGVVTSVNKDTGAITVRNWESISTFPTGGFTTKANVFKWQKEYLPIKGRTLDTHLDRANLLTMRVDNTYGGRNIWIDNITSEEYLPTVSPELITLGSSYRFFQYKATLTSTDTDVSPIINQVQLDYTVDGPTMNQIMRHGKWFNSGVKQPFWWAK